MERNVMKWHVLLYNSSRFSLSLLMEVHFNLTDRLNYVCSGLVHTKQHCEQYYCVFTPLPTCVTTSHLIVLRQGV